MEIARFGRTLRRSRGLNVRRIWVYQGDFGPGKDFRWMSVAEFRRSFTKGQAVGYLRVIQNHALRGDARDAYREGHFYTPLRIAFAEIDGVAKLYAGERGKGDTARHTVEFGKKYLGRVNPRYRDLFGLVFEMYRHGLAHTHMTKCVRFRGGDNRWVTLGWAMTDEDSHRSRHLTIEHKDARYYRIWIHVLQMVDDCLSAIDPLQFGGQ